MLQVKTSRSPTPSSSDAGHEFKVICSHTFCTFFSLFSYVGRVGAINDKLLTGDLIQAVPLTSPPFWRVGWHCTSGKKHASTALSVYVRQREKKGGGVSQSSGGLDFRLFRPSRRDRSRTRPPPARRICFY